MNKKYYLGYVELHKVEKPIKWVELIGWFFYGVLLGIIIFGR